MAQAAIAAYAARWQYIVRAMNQSPAGSGPIVNGALLKKIAPHQQARQDASLPRRGRETV